MAWSSSRGGGPDGPTFRRGTRSCLESSLCACAKAGRPGCALPAGVAGAAPAGAAGAVGRAVGGGGIALLPGQRGEGSGLWHLHLHATSPTAGAEAPRPLAVAASKTQDPFVTMTHSAAHSAVVHAAPPPLTHLPAMPACLQDDGDIPEEAEAQILDTLLRIKRKDPLIYQSEVRFKYCQFIDSITVILTLTWGAFPG